jgi:hypothetical protein
VTGTLALAVALLFIAALDALFAGFRASCGRSGLVRHRRADVLASRRGLALGALLLAPVAAAIAADAAAGPDRLDLYNAAGQGMLSVYLPYGVVVLLALGAYATLSWRRRFLASALLLGPLTLVRPLVALAGAGTAWWVTRDLAVGAVSLAAVAAVLAVEPGAGRRWYASATQNPSTVQSFQRGGREARRRTPRGRPG